MRPHHIAVYKRVNTRLSCQECDLTLRLGEPNVQGSAKLLWLDCWMNSPWAIRNSSAVTPYTINTNITAPSPLLKPSTCGVSWAVLDASYCQRSSLISLALTPTSLNVLHGSIWPSGMPASVSTRCRTLSVRHASTPFFTRVRICPDACRTLNVWRVVESRMLRLHSVFDNISHCDVWLAVPDDRLSLHTLCQAVSVAHDGLLINHILASARV